VAGRRAEDVGIERHVDGGAEVAPVLAGQAGAGARKQQQQRRQEEGGPGGRRRGADPGHAVPPHSRRPLLRALLLGGLAATASWRQYWNWTREREWDRVSYRALGSWVKACGGDGGGGAGRWNMLIRGAQK
jgi:hypothetical protein